jgi:Flp pilus assembly pilin Flp
MKTMLRRLIFDDGAQDLIEYALLGALIGIGSIVAWTNLGAAINSTYISWDSGVQVLSATMPNPQ